MRLKLNRWLVPFVALSALLFVSSTRAQRPDYPATRIDDVVEQIHGVSVADPYRWLENTEDADGRAWTEAQNALTRGYLDRFQAQREALAKRLTELYSANVGSTPRIRRSNYFFTKREGAQNHAVVYVCKDGYDKQPKVAIDPNAFSEDGTVALDWWYPSPDGRWIAYGKSASGSEKSTLHLRNVGANADTVFAIPHTRASSVAWEPGGGGFYYCRYPKPGSVAKGDENYYRHVYYHKFGTNWKDDPKVFGDEQPKEQWHGVYNSSDDKHLFLFASLDWTKNDLYFKKHGEAELRPIAVGLDGAFTGDVHDGKLYLLTDYEAPRSRVLVADVNNPSQANWKELIPQQKGVIQSTSIIGGKLVLNMLENAYSRLLIYSTDGTLEKEIELPTLGTVSGINGRHDKSELFYSFQSFAYAPVVVRHDLGSGKSEIVDRMDVEVDSDRYVTKQVWFNSKDGTRVPMFVTHKKEIKLDGDNPTLLYGYGGFNNAMVPRFRRSIFPWLDRGGVYASANLRGGGEFGKEWHLAGRLEKKQNVYDDMIAAAEKLIADKYTNPNRLAARGGSNGGLLMGAMMTQRPDLFRAVHCAVPLLDMLRYHNFSIARLWIPEYGDPDKPEHFKFIYPISPYHHVKKGAAYPAVLFTTAESDSRVDPSHARKMTARMQAASSSDRPILLWVETKAGHGAGKPLSKIIDSQVDYWIFFLWQLGMLNDEA